MTQSNKCFGDVPGCECRAIYERLRETKHKIPAPSESVPSMLSTYIEELANVILKLHGAEATHIESVPVKETFQGKTVWDGIVEVFELRGHPKATHAYAWISRTEKDLKRHIAVLKIPPVVSPITAVRAAIVQEYKLGAEES